MTLIRNPIIPGFNPDPSIVRVNEDYYIATSTFEWLPAIQLFHSRDLTSWELIGHALQGESAPDLRGIAASGGVWAPCLTHDPTTGLFYLAFSIMRNQTGDQFDVNNYLVTSPDIRGPWSEPTYLNSYGFDPSFFHDDDGRKWLITLEWDPRDGYEHPGAIILEEYDADTKSLIGAPERIFRGATDRGCLEGAHIYKRNGMYYLMAAEGGTGFGHGVTLARSSNIRGPWECDPQSPFITSWTPRYFARNNRDYLRPQYFAPDAEMQKAGHGSLVNTPNGEWYVAHLSSRPIGLEPRSVLGRETSIQQVEWTDDGWLRLLSGGTSASELTTAPAGTPDLPPKDQRFHREDFNNPEWNPHLLTPRRAASASWADLNARPSHLRLHGQESLFSRFDVSFVGARLQGFRTIASTSVEFTPTHYSQSAGLVAYYNNENFYYLRVYWSESLNSPALGILTGLNGQRQEWPQERVPLKPGPVKLQARIVDSELQFAWSQDASEYSPIGPPWDATLLSDEVARGFTGTIIGLTCQDAARRDTFADFDYIEMDYSLEGFMETTPAESGQWHDRNRIGHRVMRQAGTTTDAFAGA